MRIGEIIKENQPQIHKNLNQPKNKKRKRKEHLSFNDFENMMKHDSYSRGKGGGIRQVRRG